jgi:miniconductance mechanosensitive channel
MPMEDNVGMFDALLRFGLVALLTVGAYWLTRLLLARFALPLLRRSQPKWAAPVERSRLPMLTALLVAVITLGLAASILTDNYPQINNLVRLLDTAVGIGVFTLLLVTTASVALVIYEQLPLAKDVPLRGFVQLVQGGLYLIGALMIVATFLGVPAIYSFTALAAIFAALSFVFQDPIMGFVAGIQLAANKMVAIGDWIEVPQYGANGAVLEILMSTVKVQNWDNTVTTVPTRSLISESFKNWRPMQASGGRRLQRSVNLDIHAVRPLAPDLLAKFPVLAETWQRISSGELSGVSILMIDAAEQATNLGVYRVYLTDYLNRHPRVNLAMAHMVHQLQVSEDGLPLEIYAFLVDTAWLDFEMVTASMIEHIYATLPQFGLRPYQRPISVDIGDPPRITA